MKRMNYCSLLLVIFLGTVSIYGQENEFDLYLIDSYVTPEKPYTFILTFFTSEDVKTSLIIDNKYEVEVSNNYISDHAAEIDFTNYSFKSKYVPFLILSRTEAGDTLKSEIFEVVLPYEEFIETKEGSDPISSILFGILLYLIPSPNFIFVESENYFSLTKEFPLITFYSAGYTNASGNVSIEYTHVYESFIDNYLRLGYKHFIPVDFIQYISPGITGFTNFNGFNGIGAEMSIGLFNVYDVFTVYSRYRYNFKPSKTEQNFHEISIGLYSHFFTIDL